jgi:hypothetical protein
MTRHRNPRASVSKRPTPDNPGALNAGAPEAPARRPPRTGAEFDSHVDELREALGRVDALGDSLKQSFDQRHVDGANREVVDRRASYLIDMMAEAAQRAFDELNRVGDALGSGDADE